jgi:hypothetical protein
VRICAYHGTHVPVNITAIRRRCRAFAQGALSSAAPLYRSSPIFAPAFVAGLVRLCGYER